MTLVRRNGRLVALSLLLACNSDRVLLPPQGLKYAAAVASCGPADGPALLIVLARDPTNGPAASAPYVRIYIPDATNVDGHARAVSGPHAEASVSFVTTDSPTRMVAELARSGIVVADRSSTNNSIVGFVDIVFSTAGRLSGGFQAPIFPSTSLCP